MREIEIKAVVRDEISVRTALSKYGATISRKKKQVDRIYLPIGKSYDNLDDVNILRIRQEVGDLDLVTFNLKKHLSNELDCIEHETQINSPDSMSEIIIMLGYYEAISVSKVRESGAIREYTFNIDVVDNLGVFLELEYLTDDDNVDVSLIQGQMSEFLTTLGFNPDDVIIFSYDTELYNRSILVLDNTL